MTLQSRTSSPDNLLADYVLLDLSLLLCANALPDAQPEVSQNYYYSTYVFEPPFFAEKCITGCIPCIMHFFSFVTCQYIRPVNDRAKKNCPARCSCYSWCCSTPFMIVLIAVFAIFVITISIFPTSAFLAGWIECPYGIYNICFTVKHHDGTPILILKDTNHTTTGMFRE